jgi:hypothetical protein
MVQATTLSVLEAGRLAGRSKSHIFRAIKSGTLSAERDDAGSYRIDPAELARVFPLMRVGAPDGPPGNGDGAAVAQLEARLADALDQVHDLRRRLDAEAEERRRLTAILADQRETPAKPRRWWQFVR